jgi:hypothetical protein
MSRPAFLRIGKISCFATDDLVGFDTLVGRLGDEIFTIGEFSAGTNVDVGIEVPVPVGVTELTILESDILFHSPLATVDLTTDMDVDRIIGILRDGARYDIGFQVVSASE